MDKDKSNNSRLEHWLVMFFYLYPFLMIGTYYIEWKTLFYVGIIPMLILFVVNIYWKFKHINFISGILPIVYFIIFSEIGYLITKAIFDGICMGFYVSLIIGSIETIIRKSFTTDK